MGLFETWTIRTILSAARTSRHCESKLHVIFNRRSNLLVSADLMHQDPTPLTYAKVLAVKPGFQVNNPADLHEVRTSTLAEGRILQYGAAARFTVDAPRINDADQYDGLRKLEYDIEHDADITELDADGVHLHEAQHQWSEEMTIAQQRPDCRGSPVCFSSMRPTGSRP